jgi:glycine oxidase
MRRPGSGPSHPPEPKRGVYNIRVRTWDAIVVGGGIIGLSLALALRKRALSVLLVERGEPGREASHAAAGMLADYPAEMPPALAPLAAASARMYPEFVHELQDESGMNVDLRDQGTILLRAQGEAEIGTALASPLAELEPALAATKYAAAYLPERSVDPRALTAAVLKAAHHHGVDISSGAEVIEIAIAAGRAAGVRTTKTQYNAPIVVNCAGAWAGQLPLGFPTRPVKGHMLAVVGAPVVCAPVVRHVIRSPEVYLVPRSDGRIVIGSTLEDAGYDKRIDSSTIQRLHQAAIHLAPALAQARLHEAWTGLRPGTPDDLPILGASEIPGYFAATGHFRDGILLAPITAQIIGDLITGKPPEHDLSAFSPQRFTMVFR